MSKKLSFILIVIIFCQGFLKAQEKVQIKKFSAQEVKDDLKYMYETLEKSNYDLYALVKKEKMDSAYHAINRSINDSLTVTESFRLFQPFVAMARMSHCGLFYPWGEYSNIYLKQGGTLFPLNVYFSKEKVYVEDNFSTNKTIEKSDEILSFNEILIDQYMTKFYKNLSGPSDYFKASIVEKYSFPRVYWFFYGEQKEFPLRIKKKDGQELDLIVYAIPADEFEDKNRQKKSNKNHNREYHLMNNNTAYLHPADFLNINSDFDLNDKKTFDNTEFCHFMDSVFNDLQKNKIENLIIDLRDNQGGDNSFSDYMIAYFATKPFGISSKFRMRTSRMTKSFWKDIDIPKYQGLKEQIMSLENGSYFDASITHTDPHAESKRFKGKVYVLINRYSYSNTASVAAIIQDYKFGVIIGEETADEVTSYSAMHVFKLPNTQSSVMYPKGFMVRPNGDETPRGVVPDHIVYEDIFTDKDEVLDYTMELIKNEK